MDNVLLFLFFGSWLLCGCSLEAMFDNPTSTGVTVVALIVAIVCAAVMWGGER